MTPFLLQDCLVKETQSMIDGFRLKNIDGELSPLLVYAQNLPAKTGQGDKRHFPHIRVILIDGEDPNETDPNQVRVLIMIGIYDKDENYQGYKDLVNVLQKLYFHFARNRIFGDKYELQYPISWRIHDEDTYPYFFAGLETNWTVGKITPADTFI